SRAWRWCRRNPAVASLALSTLVALLLATVTGWVGYAHAEERRKQEAEARQDAVNAKAAAEQSKNAAEQSKNDTKQMAEKLRKNLELSLKTFETVFVAAGGTDRQGYGIPLPAPDRGPGGPRKDGPGGPPGGPGGPDGPPGGPGFNPPPKKDNPA